jgi:hypothetical protein
MRRGAEPRGPASLFSSRPCAGPCQPPPAARPCRKAHSVAALADREPEPAALHPQDRSAQKASTHHNNPQVTALTDALTREPAPESVPAAEGGPAPALPAQAHVALAAEVERAAEVAISAGDAAVDPAAADPAAGVGLSPPPPPRRSAAARDAVRGAATAAHAWAAEHEAAISTVVSAAGGVAAAIVVIAIVKKLFRGRRRGDTSARRNAPAEAAAGVAGAVAPEEGPQAEARVQSEGGALADLHPKDQAGAAAAAPAASAAAVAHKAGSAGAARPSVVVDAV